MKGFRFRHGIKPKQTEYPPEERLLTLEEAGKLLGKLNPDSVKRLCRNGQLTGAFKIGSSGWRVPQSSVTAFIRAGKKFVSTRHKARKE